VSRKCLRRHSTHMALSQLAITNAKPKDKPYLLLDGDRLHLQIYTTAVADSGVFASASVAKQTCCRSGLSPQCRSSKRAKSATTSRSK
jgi:hypothetical protein